MLNRFGYTDPEYDEYRKNKREIDDKKEKYPDDYLERDYAEGPHMNSFKPEMSFKDYFLSEKKKKKVKEEDEDMPMTVFAGPGEAEAANKGKKMRKKIPQQPNVAGAPPIPNNPGPNYTNQPSLGVTKNRTYKNKNLVSGVFKTNV